MARTIFVPICSATPKGKTSSFIRAIWENASLTRSLKKPGRSGSKTDHAHQREKLTMMNPDHRKLLEAEMVNFLFEGKEVHIEGYTPPEK